MTFLLRRKQTYAHFIIAIHMTDGIMPYDKFVDCYSWTIMQKIIKSKTPKVYKNKKLNNANFGTYSLNDYQVFLQLISKIGGVDNIGKHLQPEQLQREHTLTAKEFAQQFNLELSSVYTVLKKVAKKLTETSLTLEKPELFQTWHIALCSQSVYNNKEGSLTVRFTEEIMPYLAQVKEKFVLYNLKEVANFGSLYSTRLYELIQEFKDTGWIEKSVKQLREVFAVGKKFKLYGDFKRKTFAHAVDEINSQYDISLTFIEYNEQGEKAKLRQKVAKIRFEFKPTFIRHAVNPYTGTDLNIYIKPKSKRLIPEQIKAKETKQQAQKTKREEQKEVTDIIKKYGKNNDMAIDAVYAVKKEQERGEDMPECFQNLDVHPDQLELEI